MKVLRKLLPWVGLALLLGLTFATRCWNWERVFAGGKVYFVDADCYSRMTRVHRVAAEPWLPIRFHDFENAPTGTLPHTTAPMDLIVAALAGLLRFTAQPIDFAGAFVSPILGVLLVGFLWWWGRRLALPFRHAALLVVMISPILCHGFLLGRPDHQSLILLLTGIALAAEIAIWIQPHAVWSFLSAGCWALALWTSLFEPLILLIVTLGCRLITLGRDALRIRRPLAPTIFLLVAAGGFLFDGWRAPPTAPEIREFFPRWSMTIGELGHLKFSQLFMWTGWLLPVVPVLLGLRFYKEKNRLPLALAVLLVVTIGLSLWYARWGYFLALVFALSLPFALRAVPARPVVWGIFLISLWPVAAEWERQLFPDEKQAEANAENLEDAILLRETARALVSPEQTIILAPWWLSPALAYWSGQPCVAGSSHQSLPGIVDTARFYLSNDIESAHGILQKRRVRYVVAYEPSRVITNSAQILGHPPGREPLGKVLYENPYAAPDFLHLVYENKYFKVYEVKE